MPEREVAAAPHGHVLANAAVWSPDSRWLVYDVRSDPAGSVFDGTRIERVEVATGRVEVLYESRHGACCGVPTVNPADGRVAFILGPERPSAAWSYGPDRRHGVLVDPARPGFAVALDARDLAPPFTPGALRGGTHVHMFDPAGEWASFTYDDHVLARPGDGAPRERAARMVAAAMPRPVRVPAGHERNHDGAFFSAVVAELADAPRPGTDDIGRAYEDAWIAGVPRRLAFLGDTAGAAGPVPELFLLELPADLSVPGPAGPLEGSVTTRPRPPRGCRQTRLTFTHDRRHPGLGGEGVPRFWPRSDPRGATVAFLMRDDDGVCQLWTLPLPAGDRAAGGRASGKGVPAARRPPRRLTNDPVPVSSAFTWSADGRWLAHARGNFVCVADAARGVVHRVAGSPALPPPRPEACVFSPDGRSIAFVRTVASAAGAWNRIYVAELPAEPPAEPLGDGPAKPAGR